MAIIKLTYASERLEEDGCDLYLNTDSIGMFELNGSYGTLITMNFGHNDYMSVKESPEEVYNLITKQTRAEAVAAGAAEPNWVADSDWIENLGATPEAQQGMPVLVKFRNDRQELVDPFAVDWTTTGGTWDIVAFRYVKPE